MRHPVRSLPAFAFASLIAGLITASAAPQVELAWPGEHWAHRTPEQAGLSKEKLAELASHVGGRGCVVRGGFMIHSWGNQEKSSDVASAFKPVLSTLMLMAVQEGLLSGPDDRLSEVEPRLKDLNGGKDAGITWRHLANQLSGYGLTEKPGEAYSYNDYAITLYYDTLMEKVYRTNADEVLRTRLAGPLQFEDRYTHNAFGLKNRPGRLALSCRDFARIGLLYLRGGRWGDRQLLREDLARMAVTSPLPASTPLSPGNKSSMLPNQRSMGGKFNITPVGPGYYSFNSWLNRTNALGQRLFPEATPDVFVASGHGGMRVLYLVPGDELIVCWNDSRIEDHDASPGNPATRMNKAARLIREMVMAKTQGADQAAAGLLTNTTTLGVSGTRFTINGRPTFLLGLSYYGGIAASDEHLRADLDDAVGHGFNWIRVWANWRAFGADAAAIDGEGRRDPGGMERLKRIVRECDRRGLVVDVTLSRGNGVTGPPRLQTLETHLRAVENLVTELRPWRNWYLDLGNERNISDKRYTSFSDLALLRSRVRELNPELLVTASQGGDISQKEVTRYIKEAGVDFLTPHRPRELKEIRNTAAETRRLLVWAAEAGRRVPVHYQEPFRRGYGSMSPTVDDFEADLKAASTGGAAGWCFHNGDERTGKDGRPRRSFDLREKRLFEQFDPVENSFLKRLATEVGRR